MFLMCYFINEVVFVSGKAPFIAAILAGAVALGGTGYLTYRSMSDIHDASVSQAQSSMSSYHDAYEERITDNHLIAEYNAMTERKNLANQKLSDYQNNPDVENKDGNYVHPYFTEDDDGIWVYDVKDGNIIEDIANSAGMTVDELLEYNDVDSVDKLYKQKIIRLPSESMTQSDLRGIGIWRVGTKPQEHG